MIDAKKYLQQIKLYDAHIETKLEEVEKLKALALSVTSSVKPDAGGGGGFSGDKIGNTVAKLADLEKEINAAIDTYIDLKRAVSATVDKLTNADQLAVIRKRYFDYKSWEVIAFEMGYTYRNICYIHGKALLEIEKLLSGKEIHN